jgi:hypothetical protein
MGAKKFMFDFINDEQTDKNHQNIDPSSSQVKQS